MRAVVCGSHYGAMYVRALERSPGLGRLVGLLGRGSRRSCRLAERVGVPLYREVGELPDGVDFALVAVGSGGLNIIDELLERGIHVLCEHPVASARLEEMACRATSHRARFHVNAHFPSLPQVRSFIDAYRRGSRASWPRQLAVTFSDRALYAVAAILAEATPTEPAIWEFHAAIPGDPYSVLIGSFGPSQLVLEVQRTDRGEGLADGSPDILLDFRMHAVFSSGVLSLPSMAGPVIWSANGNRVAAPNSELWDLLGCASPVTAATLFDQRIDANCRSIEALQRDVETGEVPQNQTLEHLLRVSRLWEEAGRAISTGKSL